MGRQERIDRTQVADSIERYLERRRGIPIRTTKMSKDLYEQVYEDDYSNERSFRRVISDLKPMIGERDNNLEFYEVPSRGSINTHAWRMTEPDCDICGEQTQIDVQGDKIRFLCHNDGCEGSIELNEHLLEKVQENAESEEELEDVIERGLKIT